MPETIWKYPLQTTDIQVLEIPRWAKFLQVGVQHGVVCLWAQVDPGNPKDKVAISIYGTGHVLPINPGSYLGSYQLGGGDLVFHVYHHWG